jgi:hypothetical protein
MFYHEWYGRRFLVLPLSVTILIAGISAYLLGESSEVALRRFAGETALHDYLALPLMAVSAIAGAYAFVTWDIISRVTRRNLGSSDMLGAAIRLAIAIPLGYSFGALLKEDLGPFIAFATGAFPLETVQTILQRLAKKQLGLDTNIESLADRVTQLSGIDETIADRLEDTDITTITQLAYCDPVQLSMRTHLPFAFVSDIVAQALAWIYFEERLKKLRPMGLRGAVEFRSMLEEMPWGKTKLDMSGAEDLVTLPELSDIERTRAEAALALVPAGAKAAEMSVAAFLNVAFEIAYDPYTEFLNETWEPHDDDDEDGDEKPPRPERRKE